MIRWLDVAVLTQRSQWPSWSGARYPDCRSFRSMIIAWQAAAIVLRPFSSQMTASNRMVCLMVFTSNVASTSGAMRRRHNDEGRPAQDQLFQGADQLAKALDRVAAYQHCGSFEYCPSGTGVSDEITRGVAGVDGDCVRIGQLLCDGLRVRRR